MPPRTLASLAHALSVAADLDGALVALGEGLAEVDRGATLALLRHDARRGMLVESKTPSGPRVDHRSLETTLDHLPRPVALKVAAGAEFVDVGDQSPEYARLFGLPPQPDGGQLALKGVRVDGHLAAVIAVFESRRIFGTRAAERFAPSVALFELGFARFWERAARDEAVRTLEDTTARVHQDYLKRLQDLEQRAGAGERPASESDVAQERAAAKAAEELRRTQQRVRALEQQVVAATAQLEQAHVELHRRNELLRQRSRTLYLMERVLQLAADSDDPRRLADGLLALVGDDLLAMRCSLFLEDPAEPGAFYLAAGRGLAPHVKEGRRLRMGDGVAGRVAQTREPVLAVDEADAQQQPLLGDQYLTTSSFIVFPLVFHDRVVGIVNLTNRVQRGVFVEEDVERVRLLGLVIALAAVQAGLPERLLGAFGDG
jgi:hypothetical protein